MKKVNAVSIVFVFLTFFYNNLLYCQSADSKVDKVISYFETGDEKSIIKITDLSLFLERAQNGCVLVGYKSFPKTVEHIIKSSVTQMFRKSRLLKKSILDSGDIELVFSALKSGPIKLDASTYHKKPFLHAFYYKILLNEDSSGLLQIVDSYDYQVGEWFSNSKHVYGMLELAKQSFTFTELAEFTKISPANRKEADRKIRETLYRCDLTSGLISTIKNLAASMADFSPIPGIGEQMGGRVIRPEEEGCNCNSHLFQLKTIGGFEDFSSATNVFHPYFEDQNILEPMVLSLWAELGYIDEVKKILPRLKEVFQDPSLEIYNLWILQNSNNNNEKIDEVERSAKKLMELFPEKKVPVMAYVESLIIQNKSAEAKQFYFDVVRTNPNFKVIVEGILSKYPDFSIRE
jgi:hypothetical protein